MTKNNERRIIFKGKNAYDIIVSKMIVKNINSCVIWLFFCNQACIVRKYQKLNVDLKTRLVHHNEGKYSALKPVCKSDEPLVKFELTFTVCCIIPLAINCFSCIIHDKRCFDKYQLHYSWYLTKQRLSCLIQRSFSTLLFIPECIWLENYNFK